MHRVTLVFILFLLIPDLYIYLVYVVRKTRKTFLRSLYWLPTLLLAAGYVYFMFLTGDNVMSNHTQAIGRLAITIMLFVFPKTIFMLCSLVGVLAHFIIRRCPRSPFTAIGLVLAVVSFFNILYGTFAGITRFDTKEVEYRSANIPEGFDGYRIVQISDIHIGSWQGNPDPIKQLVDLVNGQKPDLIVFTGDLVNQQSHELDGFQEILSQLYAPDGVYSILGNHDYGSYYHWQSPKAEIANLDYLIRQQKAMGWKLLNNEHDILYHKGDSIALIGVENDGEPPFSQFADLPQAMQGTLQFNLYIRCHVVHPIFRSQFCFIPKERSLQTVNTRWHLSDEKISVGIGRSPDTQSHYEHIHKLQRLTGRLVNHYSFYLIFSCKNIPAQTAKKNEERNSSNTHRLQF